MFGACIPVKDHLIVFKGDRGLLACAKLSLIPPITGERILDDLVDAYVELGPDGNNGATYMRVESRDSVPEEFGHLFDLPEYVIHHVVY